MSPIGIDPGAFAEVVEKFAETVNEKIVRSNRKPTMYRPMRWI